MFIPPPFSNYILLTPIGNHWYTWHSTNYNLLAMARTMAPRCAIWQSYISWRFPHTYCPIYCHLPIDIDIVFISRHHQKSYILILWHSHPTLHQHVPMSIFCHMVSFGPSIYILAAYTVGLQRGYHATIYNCFLTETNFVTYKTWPNSGGNAYQVVTS